MVSEAPDAPDRGERYIALIHPFWRSVKSDIIKVVQDYSRRSATRGILIEDVGRRLSLRGNGYGLDVTLEVERERLRARYTRHPPRGEKPTVVELHVDVRPDYLVVLDSRDRPIAKPDEFLLAPLFRALARDAPARRERMSRRPGRDGSATIPASRRLF